MARESELDLVEVSPKANPPVCKILNYGKHLYRIAKLERKNKQNQKQTETKGIRLGFKTDVGDIKVKADRSRKFLGKGHNLKVSLILRGREGMYAGLAMDKLKDFYAGLEDVAKLDTPPKRQGNTLFMILTPNK